MTPVLFAFSVLALLLTPGPTNTLLALSGAARGFRPSLRLIPAEISGYLAVITPLAVIGGPFLEQNPAIATTVTFAAAAWVMFLAIKLWSPPLADTPAQLVTFQRVLITTVLNPKGLIIGLVLMPGGSVAEVLPWLALFSVLVVSVALVWIGLGCGLGRATAGQMPPLIRRGAATYLGFVAIGLAIGNL